MESKESKTDSINIFDSMTLVFYLYMYNSGLIFQLTQLWLIFLMWKRRELLAIESCSISLTLNIENSEVNDNLVSDHAKFCDVMKIVWKNCFTIYRKNVV